MPRYIIKLSEDDHDYYLMWSTVVDAPVTYGMASEDFKIYYKSEYGVSGKFKERMERVKEKGTSAYLYADVDELIEFNRAGENESCLTKDEIIKEYCHENQD